MAAALRPDILDAVTEWLNSDVIDLGHRIIDDGEIVAQGTVIAMMRAKRRRVWMTVIPSHLLKLSMLLILHSSGLNLKALNQHISFS